MGASAKKKAAQIPIDSSEESIATRTKIFRNFDINGNAWLSLAEIDKGHRDVLEFPELFDSKPMIIRAYQISLKKVRSTNPLTEGLVSRGAFKWVIIYVRFYYELWEDFGQMDSHGRNGILCEEKLKKNFEIIRSWGIKNPKFEESLTVTNPDAYHQMMKNRKQTSRSFIEWADSIICERLKQFEDLQYHEYIGLHLEK